MRGILSFGVVSLFAGQSAACGLALALAVDISGSVDPAEFKIQMDGLAAGLRDGVVADALVAENARVALVQWTGASRQAISVPWTDLGSYEDVIALAEQISKTPRVWRNFSTAIGEALDFTFSMFDAVDNCSRKVIDVSGDGKSNEGREPRTMHPQLQAAGITVNGLVIEGAEDDLTGYFWENVITGPGAFVVIANGFEEYPARIRQKLLRETTKQTSKIGAENQLIPSWIRISENL